MTIVHLDFSNIQAVYYGPSSFFCGWLELVYTSYKPNYQELDDFKKLPLDIRPMMSDTVIRGNKFDSILTDFYDTLFFLCLHHDIPCSYYDT